MHTIHFKVGTTPTEAAQWVVENIILYNPVGFYWPPGINYKLRLHVYNTKLENYGFWYRIEDGGAGKYVDDLLELYGAVVKLLQE